MALLIVGGTTVDVIFPEVPRLPVWPNHTEFTTANLTLLSEPPLVSIGGNGANAAYVAARCGASVTLHSNLGTDTFGTLARTWLTEAGCHLAKTPLVRRTPVNVTAANTRLQRATLFYPGQSPRLPVTAKNFSHSLICGWPHPSIPSVIRRQQGWRKHGIFTAYDAGPLLGNAPTLAQLGPLLRTLDLFLSNEHELMVLSGANRRDVAISRLRSVFSGHIVIKRGPEGALWHPAGEKTAIHVESPQVKAVNTVGAGDTFNGALLAALVNKTCILPALRFATNAAASVVRSQRGVLGLRVPPFEKSPRTRR